MLRPFGRVNSSLLRSGILVDCPAIKIIAPIVGSCDVFPNPVIWRPVSFLRGWIPQSLRGFVRQYPSPPALICATLAQLYSRLLAISHTAWHGSFGSPAPPHR